MSSSLEIERSEFGPFLKISLRGMLNEQLDPAKFAQDTDNRNVLINLAEVSRTSSFGIRQWIRSLKLIEERAGELILEECSYAMVNQFAMIRGSAGERASVVSVMAPMVCPECESETQVLCNLLAGPPAEPDFDCTQCGAKAELEEDPETYFVFTKDGGISDAARALLVEAGGGPVAPSKTTAAPEQTATIDDSDIIKEVGEITILQQAGSPAPKSIDSPASANAEADAERKLLLKKMHKLADEAVQRVSAEADRNALKLLRSVEEKVRELLRNERESVVTPPATTPRFTDTTLIALVAGLVAGVLIGLAF